MYLPQPTSAAGRWMLHDYRYRVKSSTPAVGGQAQIEFEQVPQDELWLINRVVVQCTAPSTDQAVAHLYLDTTEDRQALDGTRVGNFDVADMASPIQLPGASRLIVKWKGGTDGWIATCRLQLVVLRRRST